MKNKQQPLIRYWNSDKYQVSFLGIPKTGSSTVRKVMEIDVNKDWTLEPKYNEVFTVIREPIARIKSGYQECKRRGTLRPGTDDFKSFVESINRHGFFDEHIRPMIYYYNHEIVKNVFFLERINQLWNWIGVIVDQDVKENASEEYHIEVSEETKRLIKRLYRNDFALYEFMFSVTQVDGGGLSRL